MEHTDRYTVSKAIDDIFDRYERRMEQHIQEMSKKTLDMFSQLEQQFVGQILEVLQKSEQMLENPSDAPVSCPEITTTEAADHKQEDCASSQQELGMEPKASMVQEDGNAVSRVSIPGTETINADANRLSIHVRVQGVQQLRSSQREMICSSPGKSSLVLTNKSFLPNPVQGIMGDFQNIPGFIRPYTWVMAIFEEHGPGPPPGVRLEC